MSRRRVIVYTSMNDLSMFGGMETMIPQEVKYLDSLGHEVHVISPSPRMASRFQNLDRVVEHQLPSAFRVFPWLLKDFLSIMWICCAIRRIGKSSDVLSVSYSVTDGAGAVLARMSGTKIRIVLRIVGPLSYETVHFTNAKKFRYRLYAKAFMLLEAFSYMGADVILPVSEFEETNILSYGIPRDKIKIVRCGIDQRRFDGHRNSGSLRLAPTDVVIVFVGRFVEKNGPLVLSDAIPMVVGLHPNAKFVFVGDGPLRAVLETRLANMVSSGNVVFTGFREDIPEIHSQADIYAGHVSSLVEGLGQTVFEAMMSGLPVIAGEDAISRKIIDSGVSGVLVRKDDPAALSLAISELVGDVGRREQMGKKAREAALASLSFDSMMAEVFRSC